MRPFITEIAIAAGPAWKRNENWEWRPSKQASKVTSSVSHSLFKSLAIFWRRSDWQIALFISKWEASFDASVSHVYIESCKVVATSHHPKHRVLKSKIDFNLVFCILSNFTQQAISMFILWIHTWVDNANVTKNTLLLVKEDP